jgi:hypothetical protein
LGLGKRRLFTFKEKEKILEKTNGKCAHCGMKLNLEDTTVEHIYPVARGGTDDEFNLVALCLECNEQKSNMVYNIRDYYKHISREFIRQYEDELDKIIENTWDSRRSMMPEDVRLYRSINPMYTQMISRAARRNKSKAFKLLLDSSINSKYEKAYEAESKEIFDFLEKMRAKGIYKSSMYDNEFKVRELVTYGQVYTFKSPDNSIKGIIGLFNLTRNKEDIPFQVQSVAEANELIVLHIMTLCVFDTNAEKASKIIRRDVVKDFSRAKVKLIVFNEESEKHFMLNYSDKIFNIPFRFRGTDGFIQCYTGNGEREAIESMNNIEKAFKDSEETSDEDNE